MNERDEVRLRDMLDEARRARRFVQGKTRADLDAGDQGVTGNAQHITSNPVGRHYRNAKSRDPQLRER